MRLPSPTAPHTWPPALTAAVWLGVVGFAVAGVRIGLGELAGLISGYGAIVGAVVVGWLAATVAEAPIGALIRRGWRRPRAVAAVWVSGGLPLLLLVVEIAVGLAASISTLLAAGTDRARVAALTAGPERALAAIGLRLDLDPTATAIIEGLRGVVARFGDDAAAVAAGAIGAVGPVLLAVAVGVLLSLAEDDLHPLAALLSERRVGQARRIERIVASTFAAFIGRHLLLGALYFPVAAAAGALAGGDALLAGASGALLMAVPTIGQGLALLPPAAVLLIAAGPALPAAAVLLLAGWFAIANVIAPRLMAGGLRLSGTTVFLAGLAGGIAFGPLGGIVAVPAVAAAAAIARAVREERLNRGARRGSRAVRPRRR